MDFPNESGSRFVCPNDRQLALRAKLKTGWSVKTATLGSYNQTTNPLKEDEQAVIISVIKRAEKIDQLEQERVGKLVEKLENLRRNALGRHPNQCLLCGDNFGVLAGQKFVCLDCRKLVCVKCAINTSPEKNRRNSNPFITKSTAAFYFQIKSTKNKDKWLCMICAETREIWKKSGAWFFKSPPKYVPQKQQMSPPLSSYPIKKPKKTFNARKKVEENTSSDEDTKGLERRNSSTESAHEMTLVHQDDSKPNFTDSPSNSNRVETSSSSSGRDKPNVNVNNGYGYEEFEVKQETASGTSSELSRRDSLVSRTISDWNWTASDGRVSPGASSVTSGGYKNPSEDARKPLTALLADPPPPTGLIELSLNYDAAACVLHCTVYRAKNLEPTDINGLADPFCKLNILPNERESTRLRTRTVHKTRNPEFNEHLTFYNVVEEDLAAKSLYVLVLDDDRYGKDYMGEARIALGKLKVQNTIYLTLPLEKAVDGESASPELTHWIEDLFVRGRILISLCYNTKRRALLVTVCRCENLLPMDNNGYSDPFVKLALRPDPHHRKYKTSIKWKQLNPVFEEEFAFETRPTELSTQSLYVAVWDKDYGKSNDYLGGLVLGGVGSKGQRLRHWLDVIRYPDHKHKCWHYLTEDPVD